MLEINSDISGLFKTSDYAHSEGARGQQTLPLLWRVMAKWFGSSTQAVVLSAADSGFASWSWHLCLWARHLTMIASEKSWEGTALCSESQALSGRFPCLHPYKVKGITLSPNFNKSKWKLSSEGQFSMALFLNKQNIKLTVNQRIWF